MMSLNRLNGSKVWEESKNATSAPAVWNDQCFFSRAEESRRIQAGAPVVAKTEVMSGRATGVVGGIITMPETRRAADYLDYAKRAKSASEVKNQEFDASVGFATSKGSALMAPAVANLGQASVHGIWAYQGSKPFVANGRLFSSMGARTQSIDPLSGKVLWSRNLHTGKTAGVDDAATPPAIVNGKVFVANTAGEVFALSETTGETLWTVRLDEPVGFQPVVVNGRVYVATTQGTLYALNTGDGRDDGWFMWGGTAAHNGARSR
jgi:hypothetical protein